MVTDNFREAGTRLLTPLARNFPLDPMGISLLSLATAIGARRHRQLACARCLALQPTCPVCSTGMYRILGN